MKKILLLSDTHNTVDDTILKYAAQADEIWHAGDFGDIRVADALSAVKPLRGVWGNIDDTKVRMSFPEVLRFRCEEVEVLIKHIGGYPGKYDPSIARELWANPPKIFISGHSHILKVMYDKHLSTLHMNPGAAGRYGFHKARTMLRFTIEGEKIDNLEVVEFQ